MQLDVLSQVLFRNSMQHSSQQFKEVTDVNCTVILLLPLGYASRSVGLGECEKICGSLSQAAQRKGGYIG